MDPVTTGGAALRGGLLGERSAARRAACKPRIPKFPIPLPAPSAPCKPRIPNFPIPLLAPSAPLQTRYTYTLAQIPFPNSNPGPKAPKRQGQDV
jgi:hypothetical protein